MRVRNNETGEVEALRYGPATAAVEAGTHTVVVEVGDGEMVEAGEGAVPGEPEVVVDGSTADDAPADDSVSDDVAGEGERDLHAMSKDELLKLAEARGVEAKPAMKKDEIIAAIEAA